MRVSTAELRPGGVLAVAVDGQHFVIWRGADGRIRSATRYCPHLDHDLAEGYVSGDELVCPGTRWAFDGNGNAYKRNEFGRVDPKGRVSTLFICPAGSTEGIIDIELR